MIKEHITDDKSLFLVMGTELSLKLYTPSTPNKRSKTKEKK